MITTVFGEIESHNLGSGIGHIQGQRLYGADNQLLPSSTADGLLTDSKRPTTATVANVPADLTTVKTIKASNAARRGLVIYNRANIELFVKFGAGASLTDWTTVIPPNTEWFMPPAIYAGVVTGIWPSTESGIGAQVTEY